MEIGPVGFSFTTGTRRSGCLRAGVAGARPPVRVPYPPGRCVPCEVPPGRVPGRVVVLPGVAGVVQEHCLPGVVQVKLFRRYAVLAPGVELYLNANHQVRLLSLQDEQYW